MIKYTKHIKSHFNLSVTCRKFYLLSWKVFVEIVLFTFLRKWEVRVPEIIPIFAWMNLGRLTFF